MGPQPDCRPQWHINKTLYHGVVASHPAFISPALDRVGESNWSVGL